MGDYTSSGVTLRLFASISDCTVKESPIAKPPKPSCWSSVVGVHPNAETARPFLLHRLLEPNLTGPTRPPHFPPANRDIVRRHRAKGRQLAESHPEPSTYRTEPTSMHTKLTQILHSPASQCVCITSPQSIHILRQSLRSCGLKMPQLVDSEA